MPLQPQHHEREEIRKEKEHWKKEGEKFLNSVRYLNSLIVKKKKVKEC